MLSLFITDIEVAVNVFHLTIKNNRVRFITLFSRPIYFENFPLGITVHSDIKRLEKIDKCKTNVVRNDLILYIYTLLFLFKFEVLKSQSGNQL